MMSQTATAKAASAGSSRNPRLDPSTLPLRFRTFFDEGDRSALATIFLDRNQAIVRRRSATGAPLTVCLPINVFDGIAVRMTPLGETGDIEVVVELRHRDPSLSLPILVADDPADIAEDWVAWGEALNLPLLVIDQDGRPVEVESRLSAPAPPKPRRRHSYFAKRRPRFLARRKKGAVSRPERLTAREIIARD